jgi:tape measure domain-containing protein
MAKTPAVIQVQVETGAAIQEINKLKNAFTNLSTEVKNSFKGFSAPSTKFFTDTARGFKQTEKASQGMISTIKQGFAAIGTVIATIGFIDFSKGIGQTVLEADRLNRVLQGSADGFESFGTSLEYVRGLSQKLGLGIISQTKGYAQLISATKSSNVSLEDSKDIYEGISSAITALQLSADDSWGAMRAIVQIMSKGKVQAEELRGQLGERIPGAFQIAADAMGMTTKELDKFMRDGNLTAEEFLPKFGRAMKEHFGAASENAAQSATSALNRFLNQWFYLQESIGKGGAFDLLTNSFNKFTEKLKDTNFIDSVIESFNKLLVVVDKLVTEGFEALPTILNALSNILTVLSSTLQPLIYLFEAWIAIKVLSWTKNTLISLVLLGLKIGEITKFATVGIGVFYKFITSMGEVRPVQRFITYMGLLNKEAFKFFGLEGTSLFNKFSNTFKSIIIQASMAISNFIVSIVNLNKATLIAFATNPITIWFAILSAALIAIIVYWEDLIRLREKYNNLGKIGQADQQPELNENQKARQIEILNDALRNKSEMLKTAAKSTAEGMSVEERAAQIYGSQYVEINRVITAAEELLRIRKKSFDPKETQQAIKTITPTQIAPLDKKIQQEILKLQADTLEALDKGREAELMRQQTSYLKEYDELEKSDEAIQTLVEWNRARKIEINKKWDEKDYKEKEDALKKLKEIEIDYLKSLKLESAAEIVAIAQKYKEARYEIQTNRMMTSEQKINALGLLNKTEAEEVNASIQKVDDKFSEMSRSINDKAIEARRSIEDLKQSLKDLQNQIQTEKENLNINLTIKSQAQLERVQSTRDLQTQYEKDMLEFNRRLEDIDKKGIDDRNKLMEEYSNRTISPENYQERLDQIKKSEEEQTEVVRQQTQARTELYKVQNESILSKEQRENITKASNFFTDHFVDAFDEVMRSTKSLSSAFKDMVYSILTDLAKLAAKQAMLGAFQAALGGAGGTGGTGGALATILGAAGGLMRQAGGPVRGGSPYVVGEAGPELFIPNSDGRIKSNAHYNMAMNNKGGGEGMSITVNMNNPVSTADDARMKGKLIAAEIRNQMDRRMVYQRKPGGILNPQPVM